MRRRGSGSLQTREEKEQLVEHLDLRILNQRKLVDKLARIRKGRGSRKRSTVGPILPCAPVSRVQQLEEQA